MQENERRNIRVWPAGTPASVSGNSWTALGWTITTWEKTNPDGSHTYGTDYDLPEPATWQEAARHPCP
ncbi:MAG: hypothetical protein KA758_06950 [Acidimicrobiales bacterium]|nr:hypothetical protein [Acidimicrobiales bacterium]